MSRPKKKCSKRQRRTGCEVHRLGGKMMVEETPGTALERWQFRKQTWLRRLALRYVSAVPEGCFDGCSLLEEADLGQEITYIGKEAFRGTGLRTLYLPASVVEIDETAFADCWRLKRIETDENSCFRGEGDSIYDRLTGELVASSGANAPVPVSSEEPLRRETPQADRGEQQLTWWGKLRENGAELTGLEVQGDSAKIVIPDTWQGMPVRWLSPDLFDRVQDVEQIIFPDELEEVPTGLCFGMSHLRRIELSYTVKLLGKYAFGDCKSLREIDLPYGLEVIGAGCFLHCTALREVRFSPSVRAIGKGAFEDCRRLGSITLPDQVTQLGEGMFCRCESLRAVHLPKMCCRIPSRMFAGCKALDDVEWPELLQTICTRAFDGCESLLRIRVPEGVTYLGEEAFRDCTGLQEIILPDGLERIGNGGFANCKRLLRLRIPEGIEEVGSKLFGTENVLEDLYLPRDPEFLDENMLLGTEGRVTIYTPAGGAAQRFALRKGYRLKIVGNGRRGDENANV